MADYKNLNEVANAVTSNGGVLSFGMWEIRDAYGAMRLGSNVRSNMSDELQGLGILSFPRSLPDNQNEMIRLYKAGTAAGKLIEAALSIGENYDDLIRESAASEASLILAKVRELVCE